MKWLLPVGVMLAFAGLTASCNERQLAEDNAVRTGKPSKAPLPSCRLQNPLGCASSGALIRSPDFVGELHRFVGKPKYDWRSINDPLGLEWLADSALPKPEPIDRNLIFIESCPAHGCGEIGAAILQDGKIVAVAIQYDTPWERDVSREELSTLDIFIDRLTPESAKWVEIMRNWRLRGKKVRVHELSRMQEAPKPAA